VVIGRQQRGIGIVAAGEEQLLQERLIGGGQRLAPPLEAGDKLLDDDGLDGGARDVSLMCAS
jgi:hypothetical protein